MVYQNKLVAAIKVNGQILREVGQAVLIPFGSEYSVFLKNLNSVRVKVKVSIDGTDATGDTWLVVNPNSTLDLERFISNGNMAEGRRFKFIERTKAVEQHRGVKIDDGLVRVEYQTERIQPIVNVPNYVPYNSGDYTMSFNAQSATHQNVNAVQCNVGEAGITVQGSLSSQSFVSVSDFPTDGSEVLVLQLRGVVGGKKVGRAMTVKSKATCASCGKVSKGGVEFCARCGTAL